MSQRELLIAPSILSADFSRLGLELDSIASADWVHVDVMDGRFVPNITIGPFVVKAVKQATQLPLDVHLMIVEPEKYLEAFAKAGADRIGVHVETCPHLHRTVQQIKDLSKKACIVLNPSTPAAMVEPVIGDIDQILVMTVNPGFGGQSFIESQLQKIEQLRTLIEHHNPEVILEVDGGVTADNIDRVVKAGAQACVAGTAVFGQKDRAAAIQALREAAGCNA